MTGAVNPYKYQQNCGTQQLLEENIALKEPISLLQKWMAEAQANPDISLPNAMCLSTASKHGLPSARNVILNNVSSKGLTFFTNYESKKAKDIAENPNVALTIFWGPPNRQIRVQGKAVKLDRSVSEEQFKLRSRENQIELASSPQSQAITNRTYLDQLFNNAKYDKQFGADSVIPLPDFLGGYLVIPHTIEFGQGRPNLLVDRIRFRRGDDALVNEPLVHKGDDGWVYERLAP